LFRRPIPGQGYGFLALGEKCNPAFALLVNQGPVQIETGRDV